MIQHYWAVFRELIQTPFEHAPLIWGVVPLYFGLLLNELTSDEAHFRTAVQTGFSFLWAGAQWLFPYFSWRGHHWPYVEFKAVSPVNLIVTFLVIIFGAIALVCGIRKHFPDYTRFLGYTRFANYFMIVIFPIQAHCFPWTWDRLAAVALFAVPIWLVLHFGMMLARD